MRSLTIKYVRYSDIPQSIFSEPVSIDPLANHGQALALLFDKLFSAGDRLYFHGQKSLPFVLFVV
jgi:hypothetical protein